MIFLNSLRSEWLKTKHSAASWLCLAGGFFLPLMFLIGFLKDHTTIDSMGGKDLAWLIYNLRIWRFMGIFLLPMGIVLAASLITQLEYKNNAWKQVHTTPQEYATIFTAKFTTIVLMTLKFFLFFNMGMLLAGILPGIIFNSSLPLATFPLQKLIVLNGHIFIACLPLLALQFIMSLLSKNFMIPIGIGMAAVIGSLILTETWQYAWLSPYSYNILGIMGKTTIVPGFSIYALSACYFVVLITIAYLLYRFKKEKG